MTHDELREMFATQADWRDMKAEQHADDSRNQKAVAILLHLAETAGDVPQSLLDAYNAALVRWQDAFEIRDGMLGDIGFRKVGWRIMPGSAEAFLREFLDRLTWLEKHRPELFPKYRPTIVGQ